MVELKFDVCQSSNCKIAEFRETTGIYDLTNNPTGWGAPNEVVGDAVSASLVFTDPSGTVYPAIDMLAKGFPKDVDDAVEIPVTDLDPSLSNFVDGIWNLAYSVTTGTTTYNKDINFFFICGISACVCQEIAELKANDCSCDPEKVDRVLKAKAYLDALSYAVGCNNTAAANEIYDLIKRLCDCGCDCGCGGCS